MKIEGYRNYYLGKDVLNKRFQMYTEVMGMDGEWIDLNIQPARPINWESAVKKINTRHSLVDPEKIKKEVNICPHYNLLETIARIFGVKGIELSEFPNFCGVFRDRIMVGDRHGRHLEEGGVEESPVSFCVILHSMLNDAIELAEEKMPQEIVVNAGSNKDDIEAAAVAIGLWKKYLIGKELLRVWGENVPRVVTMDEISAAEIVKKVKILTLQLKEQIIGNKENFFTDQDVALCGVAPKHYRNQWMHID